MSNHFVQNVVDFCLELGHGILIILNRMVLYQYITTITMEVSVQCYTSISVPMLFVLNFRTEYSAVLIPCEDMAEELLGGG